MTRKQAQALTSVALAVGIVCIDQVIKVAVKTGMYLHQSIKVTNWFHILFTENDGMAFGMEVIPKWFLTSFRIHISMHQARHRLGIYCLSDDDNSRSCRQHLRLLVLRDDLQQPTCSFQSRTCPMGHRLWATNAWTSCRYVLLPSRRMGLASKPALHRWRAFHILLSHLQLCRRQHFLWCYCAHPFLQ